MSIFAISDLHLSFNKKVGLKNINPKEDIYKPMEVFGWYKHYDLISSNWLKHVTDKDTVLIPGDISWAMKIEQVINDFHWLSLLPGRKVLSPGNHCYYAASKRKLAKVLPSGMYWLDGDFLEIEGKFIVATRGWILPGEDNFTANDMKIYLRQAGRLKMALESCLKHSHGKDIIAMLHFPPITKNITKSLFLDLMLDYKVTICVYGHLHGLNIKDAVEGNISGIEFRLVSCDAIGFKPLKIC